MKNIYYLMCILCLPATHIRPMSNDNKLHDTHYTLDLMPQDILKIIVLAQSSKFALKDLQTAKYYKKILDLSKHITPEKALITIFQYCAIIYTLSCTTKKLRKKLTSFREQLNRMRPNNALLKLNYFDEFFIALPTLQNYNTLPHSKHCQGHVTKITKGGWIELFIKGTFYHTHNEEGNISLREIIIMADYDKSLGKALYILQKFNMHEYSESCNRIICKYVNMLTFCQNISQQVYKNTPITINLTTEEKKLRFDFELLFLSSQTNQENEPVIPYLLIKDLLADA